MRKQKVRTPFKVIALIILLALTVSATLNLAIGPRAFLISFPAYIFIAFISICALFDLDGRKSADALSRVDCNCKQIS